MPPLHSVRPVIAPISVLDCCGADLFHGVRPDGYQVSAVDHLAAGRSVLVSAPTGSGKTLVAEAAAALALASGQRLFYTTPLKALSNQKYRDLGALFGADRCGLLTGDLSIRPDAPLVVMTTEVFRNMLIQPGRARAMRSVRFAVLDECHYIGRVDRGTVWEEAILACLPHILLLALSATVPNARLIAGWMNAVHPPVALVEESVRPAPLRFFSWDGEGLSPLDDRPERHRGRHGWPAGDEPNNSARVVERLRDAAMLPAIYFQFSRRGCEASLETCGSVDLLDTGEQQALGLALDDLLDAYPALGSYPFPGMLRRGLAVHHAGMLPAWRLAVERLFQQKLLKVVFATETLAAGMNMPARTTVISSLRRPGERGFRPLSHTEFHQMAGRAGRRGMDLCGNVVVLESPDDARWSCAGYVDADPEPLGSCLQPGYSLALNWLPALGEEGARRMIEKGLACYGRAGAARPPGVAPSAWVRFEAAASVLRRLGFLDGNRPIGLGCIAAALQCDNELLAALLLGQAIPDDPGPEVMAAWAGALVGCGRMPAAEPKRDWRLKFLPGVRDLLRSAVDVAASLRVVQHECRFSCPTSLSSRFACQAARWAGGCSWGELLDGMEMDEGDVAYSLRNCMDLLGQVEESPASGPVRAAAAAARRAMDRSPVNEVT